MAPVHWRQLLAAAVATGLLEGKPPPSASGTGPAWGSAASAFQVPVEGPDLGLLPAPDLPWQLELASWLDTGATVGTG